MRVVKRIRIVSFVVLLMSFALLRMTTAGAETEPTCDPFEPKATYPVDSAGLDCSSPFMVNIGNYSCRYCFGENSSTAGIESCVDDSYVTFYCHI
jgi:hypothetical protein